MSKLRIYEYAKEQNMTSKEVINKLQALNFNISNHMSILTDEMKEKLEVKTKQKQETKTKARENIDTKKNQTNQPKQKAKQRNKHKNQEAKKPHEAPKQQNKKQETPEENLYHSTLTVSELAEKVNKDTSEINKKLMFLGVMATINQDLDDDAVELICSEYDVE